MLAIFGDDTNPDEVEAYARSATAKEFQGFLARAFPYTVSFQAEMSITGLTEDERTQWEEENPE